MSDENKVEFESDDYYGPAMKLAIDCSSPGAVSFSIEGEGSGMTASISYSLFMSEDVECVIAELTAWRERERERLGR